jgi:hypothetical protein
MTKKTLWFTVGLVLSGCAPLLDGGPYVDPEPRPMEFAFDRVKLILPEVTRDDDRSTVDQPDYLIAPSRRLLLHFSNLHEHVSAVRTEGEHKVQGRVTVIGDAAEAAASLTLCPLNRQFALFATWEAAFPFNGAGRWARPGGDYDASGCVKGAASVDDPQILLFDLTRWFMDYPRSRRLYYGLIATSSKPVTIVGDQSGGSFPRLLWKE